jgi:hypothetical protein
MQNTIVPALATKAAIAFTALADAAPKEPPPALPVVEEANGISADTAQYD